MSEWCQWGCRQSNRIKSLSASALSKAIQTLLLMMCFNSDHPVKALWQEIAKCLKGRRCSQPSIIHITETHIWMTVSARETMNFVSCIAVKWNHMCWHFYTNKWNKLNKSVSSWTFFCVCLFAFLKHFNWTFHSFIPFLLRLTSFVGFFLSKRGCTLSW